MKKTISRLLLFCLFIIGLASFRQLSPAGQESRSVVMVKLKYGSYGITGFGGMLRIRNVNTNEIFESNSKTGLNPFVSITNVPNGEYVVEEVQIISGSYRLTLKNDSDFNLIKITEPKIYYLGSYKAKKVAPLMKRNFQVTKTDNDSEKKIHKQANKVLEKETASEIDYEYTLLKENNINIEI
jgi:hypothetical protein